MDSKEMEEQSAAFVRAIEAQHGEKATYTLAEVRDIFRMRSNKTVYNWVSQGEFPGAYKSTANGGGIRILRESVVQFYLKRRL